ncbi:MAG: DUF4347 domain-containing protein, partial [Okeania sp. SIO2D1]|nr:DUF4347 domain-containing protein [Okeania sp. SIO2D1]
MTTYNICQSLSAKTSIQFVDFSTQQAPQKIVFIDSNVEDYQTLANGVLPGYKVVILDRDRDGIHQITNIIQKVGQVSSIHIVSHGTPGCLQLGNSELNIKNINNYATELETWPVANILVYGCRVAAGDAGTEYLEKLHQITGANIAASAQATGSSAMGGNWQLEVTKGEIEVSLAFSDDIQKQWEHILDPFEDQPFIFQVIDGQLAVFTANTLTYRNIGEPVEGGYNAAGFNRQDNFIYGILGGSTNSSGRVIRIHSNGTAEDVLINGATINVVGTGDVNLNSGDVDDDNNLWVRTGNRQLTRINLLTGEQVAFALEGDSLQTVSDIIYNDTEDKFYGAGPNGNVYTIDVNEGTISQEQVDELETGRQFGAAWTDASNNLIVSRNNPNEGQNSELYQINDYTTTNPSAEEFTDQAEATTRNDGMSNPE